MFSAMPVASAIAATFEELAAQAAAARRANGIPNAIELYRQAVQLRPSWVEGWWFLGTLSYASYQYAGCESAFDEFVKLDDKRPVAWALLGLCEFETGKYDQSLEHLRRGLAAAKELGPEVEAGVRFHYGLLLSRAGFFEQGKRELERYIGGDAREPMLIAAIGLNALHLPLLPKDVPPESMDAVMKAGTAERLWLSGDVEKAGAAFRELVTAYPNLPGVHYVYGVYLSYSSSDDAIAELRRELELHPRRLDAAIMLALLLVHSDDPAAALPYAKEVASAHPSDALAEYAYGEALLAAGDLRPAVARLEAAEQLDPGALEYHMALATAYSRAGRYDDSRRERYKSMEMSAGIESGDAGPRSARAVNERPPEN